MLTPPTVTLTARVPTAGFVPGVHLTRKVQVDGAAGVPAGRAVVPPPNPSHVPAGIGVVVTIWNSPVAGVTVPARPRLANVAAAGRVNAVVVGL
jgi:hypothetical protein